MPGKRPRLTIIEVLVAVSIIGVAAALMLPALRQTPHASSRTSCANNLRQWDIIFRMFADEHGGEYPRLSATTFWFFPESRDLYPEYWTDYTIALCPSDIREMDGLSVLRIPEGDPVDLWNQAAAEMADGVEGAEACFHYLMSIPRSYLYPGYVCGSWRCIYGVEFLQTSQPRVHRSLAGTVCDPPVPQAMVPAEHDEAASFPGLPYDPNNYPGSDGEKGSPLHPLRTGVERLLITDTADAEAPERIRATIPVMWDALSTQVAADDYEGGHPALVPHLRTNHVPAGGNVLFLDGHVAFIPFRQTDESGDDGPFPYGADLQHAWQAINNGAG